MKQQKTYIDCLSVDLINEIIAKKNIKKVMFICGNSFDIYADAFKINKLLCKVVRFSDFTPNPSYTSVFLAVKKINQEKCDMIIAFGGGSAIDVAKCTKLFYGLDTQSDLLTQKPIMNKIPLIAIPTTSGSGSESTEFAVIYKDEIKKSVSNENILPDYVFLQGDFIKELSEYQKKATMLDALCHAIEGMWSINSNKESMKYSKMAIKIILENMEKYLENDKKSAKEMLIAANYAGKAINISKTTAAHAMSYGITKKFNLAHGHAAAICLYPVWEYIISNSDKCIDKRGKIHLEEVNMQIAGCFQSTSPEAALIKYKNIIKYLRLDKSIEEDLLKKYINDLIKTVNIERLNNTPIRINEELVANMYKNIL